MIIADMNHLGEPRREKRCKRTADFAARPEVAGAIVDVGMDDRWLRHAQPMRIPLARMPRISSRIRLRDRR
jgi:hypothetical protein